MATQIEPQIEVSFLFAQEDWTKTQETIDLFWWFACWLMFQWYKTNTLHLSVHPGKDNHQAPMLLLVCWNAQPRGKNQHKTLIGLRQSSLPGSYGRFLTVFCQFLGSVSSEATKTFGTSKKNHQSPRMGVMILWYRKWSSQDPRPLNQITSSVWKLSNYLYLGSSLSISKIYGTITCFDLSLF